MEFFWIVLAFFCGSLPLSVWLGRLFLGTDIRQFGDGNPGAANVWRAGGVRWGLLAVFLDFLKGAIPVGIANFVVGVDGLAMAAVAIAPVAGHAFSPLLGFHGGKALAVAFGIWAGLTLWFVPTILGLFFGVYLALVKPDGWAVLLGLLSLFAVLLIVGESILFEVWVGTALILGWMQRADLAQKPKLRFTIRRS